MQEGPKIRSRAGAVSSAHLSNGLLDVLCACNAERCSNAFDSMDGSSGQGKALSLKIVKVTQPATFDFTVRTDQVDTDVNLDRNRH